MGGRHIDAAIVGPQTEIGRLSADVTIVQEMLAADDITYRHDRVRLRAAVSRCCSGSARRHPYAL